MHHFFVEKENIFGEEILISDSRDFNHAVRVLRLEKGEQILVSGQDGKDYLCTVDGVVNAAGGESALRARRMPFRGRQPGEGREGRAGRGHEGRLVPPRGRYRRGAGRRAGTAPAGRTHRPDPDSLIYPKEPCP